MPGFCNWGCGWSSNSGREAARRRGGGYGMAKESRFVDGAFKSGVETLELFDRVGEVVVDLHIDFLPLGGATGGRAHADFADVHGERADAFLQANVGHLIESG